MSGLPYVKFFNRKLAFSCGLIALSTFNYGFDNQAFATSQAMDAFDKQFGYYDETEGAWALEPYWLSLFNSLNYIGFAAGVLIGSPISARFGRRWCMFVMSVYALITATISVTSTSKEQIMAARILNYVYVGMELSVCPVFQSEIVSTPVRGMIVATYQFSLILGGLVINGVCRGTAGIQDNRAWRIPIGLFYVVPSIIAVSIFFIPESPRWLLLKDRHEEARRNLHLLREGTKSEAEIDEEFLALRTTLENEPEQGRFSEMWKGVNLKRTLIVLFVNFFQQATGQAFASQYGGVYAKSLGTVNPFDITLANSGVNGVCILVTLLLVDKVGRNLLVAGAIIQIMALFAMAGLGTASTVTDPMKTAIVALLSIFSAGFSLGWAPLTYVVTTEIIALRLRDITARSAFLVNVVANFLVNFSVPYLINAEYAGLDSKVGFIFGSIAVAALIFIVFFVPECKGKSLEQLDLMFHNGVPLRKFGSYEKGVNPESSVLAQTEKKGVVEERIEKPDKESS